MFAGMRVTKDQQNPRERGREMISQPLINGNSWSVTNWLEQIIIRLLYNFWYHTHKQIYAQIISPLNSDSSRLVILVDEIVYFGTF